MSSINEWIKIESYDEEWNFEERASEELRDTLGKLMKKYKVNLCNDEVTLLIQVMITKPTTQSIKEELGRKLCLLFLQWL